MVADKGKKVKLGDDEIPEHLDAELVLSIEKLQEIQDELEKVQFEPFLATPFGYFSSFGVLK